MVEEPRPEADVQQTFGGIYREETKAVLGILWEVYLSLF
jgi:hypothetical protein